MNPKILLIIGFLIILMSSSLVIVGGGGFYFFNQTETDTTGTACNTDLCENIMQDWIVNKGWAFNDSANTFGECKNCKSRWFKENSSGNFFKDPFQTSTDGINWSSNSDKQKAFNAVKLTTTPVKKFRLGAANRSTEKSSLGDNQGEKAVYIDRQNVKCYNGAVLNRFQLKRDGNSIYYQHDCAESEDLGSEQLYGTSYATIGPSDGRLIYLDRHDVDCGADRVLSGFGVTRNGGNWNYIYYCKPANAELSCRFVSTQNAEHGGGEGKLIYLDRHNVACEKDEAINRFKLINNSDGTIRYEYKCCKY